MSDQKHVYCENCGRRSEPMDPQAATTLAAIHNRQHPGDPATVKPAGCDYYNCSSDVSMLVDTKHGVRGYCGPHYQVHQKTNTESNVIQHD